jgi:hypothetical protein
LRWLLSSFHSQIFLLHRFFDSAEIGKFFLKGRELDHLLFSTDYLDEAGYNFQLRMSFFLPISVYRDLSLHTNSDSNFYENRNFIFIIGRVIFSSVCLKANPSSLKSVLIIFELLPLIRCLSIFRIVEKTHSMEQILLRIVITCNRIF